MHLRLHLGRLLTEAHRWSHLSYVFQKVRRGKEEGKRKPGKKNWPRYINNRYELDFWNKRISPLFKGCATSSFGQGVSPFQGGFTVCSHEKTNPVTLSHASALLKTINSLLPLFL